MLNGRAAHVSRGAQNAVDSHDDACFPGYETCLRIPTSTSSANPQSGGTPKTGTVGLRDGTSALKHGGSDHVHRDIVRTWPAVATAPLHIRAQEAYTPRSGFADRFD